MNRRTLISIVISILLALMWFANVLADEVKITAKDGMAGGYFGISVDISGDYAIVGAPWDDDRGEDTGSVFPISNMWHFHERRI